ncbi:hypothetical protein [Yersinia pestis]
MLVLVTALQGGEAQSDSCTSELSNLNVCAPFVVPGANDTTPSSECCGALEAVNRDCLCNTLRIAARLPTQCQLNSLTCDVN